jgi:hypothetical protein
VEKEVGAEGSNSPMVATTLATGDGRSGQATPAAIQIASELERVRGSE